ncbi:multiple sugar transport system permease protein [Nakamurella panacisegetis]|uniref:Multiple sugar transport system permease protein n=1 Tax=Nakamurella panacisegetis TaxID=1090615 RepID=A0A1H0JEQ6_9ACTN|nr:sugar ABC transporter permease [Nakamurella panacisegetis]SDO42285.1 multiple sugar transport system permease protein [Nakamurella panacisegetis]
MTALPWLTPALILIIGVVLYPAGYMIYTAFRKITKVGTDTGAAGWNNFKLALTFPGVNIGHVFVNTFVWVIVVVAFTVVISLALAQFLNKAFRGRKVVRLAVIVPWAASVVMTTSVFQYGLNPDYGIINKFLVDIGILSAPYGFTQQQGPAFIVAMVVAIFVSLPFTTYTILAGLQAVPGDVIEAAHVDGAGATARYFRIVLPILRPALAVAVLINIINVFNSLPILKVLTGSLPGYASDITTTLIFKYKTTLGPGVASALSVVNFLVCLLIIGIYLVVVKPTKER